MKSCYRIIGSNLITNTAVLTIPNTERFSLFPVRVTKLSFRRSPPPSTPRPRSIHRIWVFFGAFSYILQHRICCRRLHKLKETGQERRGHCFFGWGGVRGVCWWANLSKLLFQLILFIYLYFCGGRGWDAGTKENKIYRGWRLCTHD